MAKMMSDANDQWPYKQAPARHHGRGRARETRQFRADVGDELVELENEVDDWWPWVERKHMVGYHEEWMWRTGQYAEIADSLRYGEPLPDLED